MHVSDGVMTSHDAFTSGTFRVLTIASLQLLKMEALISAPGDYEVRYVIEFLRNKRRRMLTSGDVLLHDNGHTGFEVNKSPAGVQLGGVLSSTLQPEPRAQWFPSFLTPQGIPVRSASAFSAWQSGGDECHNSGSKSHAADFYDTEIQKLVPQCNKYLNSGGEYVEKQPNTSFRPICSNKSFHYIGFCSCKRPQGNLLLGPAT